MTKTPEVIDHQVAGADIGGTKIEIIDNTNHEINRYDAAGRYQSLGDVLDEHFASAGGRPEVMVLAAAGESGSRDGSVQMTNRPDWPRIVPAELAERYPGTRFHTVNDMVGMMAGAMVLERAELDTLKPGHGQDPDDVDRGTRLIVSQSTGIGAARAVFEPELGRYIYIGGEGGHADWQPQTEAERGYLAYRQRQLGRSRVSAEEALSGKHGIEQIARYLLGQTRQAQELEAALGSVSDTNPAGKILREFATQDQGRATEVARHSLEILGSLMGSFIRDMAVVMPPRGGVYVTGSPMIALGEYYASQTAFNDRFVAPGSQHDNLMEKIPIYLVSNPHIAARGALSIARAKIS